MTKIDFDVKKAPGYCFPPEIAKAYAYPLVGQEISCRDEMTEYHKLRSFARDTWGTIVSSQTNVYSCKTCAGGCKIKVEKGPKGKGTVTHSTPCTCPPRDAMIDWEPGSGKTREFKTYETAGASVAVTGTILCWINIKKKVRVVRIFRGGKGLARKNHKDDVLTTFLTSCGRVFVCHYKLKDKVKNAWSWVYLIEQNNDEKQLEDASSLQSTGSAFGKNCAYCQEMFNDKAQLFVVNCAKCTETNPLEPATYCWECMQTCALTRNRFNLEDPTHDYMLTEFNFELDHTSYGFKCVRGLEHLCIDEYMRFDEYPNGRWTALRVPNWFFGDRAVVSVVDFKELKPCYDLLILPMVLEYIEANKFRACFQGLLDAVANDTGNALLFGSADEDKNELENNRGVTKRAMEFYKQQSYGVPWLKKYKVPIPEDVKRKAAAIESGAIPPINAIDYWREENKVDADLYENLKAKWSPQIIKAQAITESPQIINDENLQIFAHVATLRREETRDS